MADTLICVDPISRGFLRSQPLFSFNSQVEVFGSAEQVFDRLWHEPRGVGTITLDIFDLNLEELSIAALDFTGIFFVARSPEVIDEHWRRRLLTQENIALPRTDVMVWIHTFSRQSIDLRSDSYRRRPNYLARP